MANEKKTKVDESVDNKNDEKTNDNENNTKTWDSEWMIRPCDVYKEEYSDCTSFRGRFQQKFVYGEKLDCSQWKIDYENCQKWKKTNDQKTYDELLTSEKQRRLERLRPHYKNDVWQKRDEPPSDWNSPLPDWLVKRNQGTFLALKQDDIENNRNTSAVLMPGCVIL